MNNYVVVHNTDGLHWKWGQGSSKDNTSSIKKLKASKETVDTVSSTAGSVKGMHDKKKMDLIKSAAKKNAKDMSDEELRAKVNRMNLEEQYSKLASSDKQTGKDVVSSFLGATTTALGVAGAALTVAVLVKQLTDKVG